MAAASGRNNGHTSSKDADSRLIPERRQHALNCLLSSRDGRGWYPLASPMVPAEGLLNKLLKPSSAGSVSRILECVRRDSQSVKLFTGT